MTKRRTCRLIALLTVVALAGLPAVLSADVVAYDPFNYDDGSLTGQDGGDGWAGQWGADDDYTIEDGRVLVQPSGWTNEANRSMDTAMSGDIYFSFALSPDFDYGDEKGNVTLFLGADDAVEKFMVKISLWNGNLDWSMNTQGDSGDTSGIENNVSIFSGAQPPLDGSQSYLVAGKIEWDVNGADDRLSVWVDPGLSETAPSGVLERDSGISSVDRIRFNSWENNSNGVNAYIDDLIIGEAWVDVVPEPATMSLLAIGGLGMLVRRRRG